MLKKLSQRSSIRLNVRELVFTCVTSVAFGVAFWGWSFANGLVSPFLKIFGFRFLFNGFWLIPGIFAPFIIRKPGVAILASCIAAFVEGLLSKWGIQALVWGLVQGSACEIVFFLGLYRYWQTPVLYIASASAGIASFALSYYQSHYSLLSFGFNAIQFSVALASSLFFCGYLTQILIKRLHKQQMLQNFVHD